MLRIKERKSTDQTGKGQNAENHVTMETCLFLGAIIFVDTDENEPPSYTTMDSKHV